MKVKHLVIGVVVVAAIGLGWALFSPNEPDDQMILKTHQRRRIKTVVPFDPKRFASESTAPSADVKVKKVRKGMKTSEWPSDWSKTDRALATQLQSVLDDDNLEGTVMAAERALKSANPEIRLMAVEALSWFGKDTIPELTVCMADPDEEVSMVAAGYWESGVAQMDSAKERVETSILALNTLSDPDALLGIGSLFSGSANELIDGEEDEALANEYRIEVVQWLVDMIDKNDGVRSEFAKEIYSDISASPWISLDEAEKFVADPEKYEAPDLDADFQPEDSASGASRSAEADDNGEAPEENGESEQSRDQPEDEERESEGNEEVYQDP